MTANPTAPQTALKPGPLTAEMAKLLKAGSSMLRTEQGRMSSFAGIWPATGLLCISGGGAWAASSLSYIGERDAEGWIAAPEGGWPENPVPGIVETRYEDGGFVGPSESELPNWPAVIAFRPAVEAAASQVEDGRVAQSVEPSAHNGPGAGSSPAAPTNYRAWLARQLLDERLTDAEAFEIVASHPSITPRPDDAAVLGMIKRLRAVRAFGIRQGKPRNPDGPDAAALIERILSPQSGDEACLTIAEQKAQATRCSCRGADDYCPCQNAPDTQTRKDRGDA